MLTWSQEYSTGVDEIDKQHQILFRFINTLEQEILKGKGKEIIEQAIEFMETYAQEHFQFEEMCMYGYSCPMAGKNKEAHQDFINKFKEIKEKADFDHPKSRTLLKVHQYCEDWIKSHILNIDSHMKECKKNNPAKTETPD